VRDGPEALPDAASPVAQAVTANKP